MKIVTVMAGKASNLHDYFPCNPGGGSVSGRDCLASVVRALGSHCRHCNRQLEHDRTVVEPLVGRSQPRCPRRTSVASARSSLCGLPTPSHHDLDLKRHFAPLPRAPRSFQNSLRPAIAQKRIGHQPRNTKRIRGQVGKAGVILLRRLCGMAALE